MEKTHDFTLVETGATAIVTRGSLNDLLEKPL
jgi:hypothetical protein